MFAKRFAGLWVWCVGLSFAAYSQQVRIVTVEQVEQLLNNNSDTVHIVNFWATWCAPCVKELPDFIRLSQDYRHQPVQLWLISMDFRSSLESKLKPFLERRKIQQPIWLLDNTDYDSWINRIDAHWQGDLPFTLIFNNYRKQRKAIYGETTYQHLEQLVRQML
ncbi:MAG: TlpA disulfide reductase family protein [Cytophagales bacterium]|nr:TlpA family protein disulfide reductase [Bernardetiaceae bacterium]MDW8210095.1 TlpA disulfide reductase family protein [Cytophagales bacterium]